MHSRALPSFCFFLFLVVSVRRRKTAINEDVANEETTTKKKQSKLSALGLESGCKCVNETYVERRNKIGSTASLPWDGDV